MLNIFAIFFYVLSCTTASWTNDSKLTFIEKQLILDLHNWYRAQVSRGDVFRQPESADMTVLEWDDRLAEIAQSQAQFCRREGKVEEKTLEEQLSTLNNPVFGKLAINEFYTNNTENVLKIAVHSWFQLHKKFSFDNKSCQNGSCQEYKNMMFSNTFVLGCESHKCLTGINLVCLYANSEKEEDGQQLYKTGLSCTACPQDLSFCMDGSLCASKFHCRDSKISNTCRCLVLPEVCVKHGDFDSSRCRCRCQPGWTGLNCERTCTDISPICNKRKWACTEPPHKSEMLRSCPQTCKWCQNNPNSIPIFSEQSFKINTIYDPIDFELDEQAEPVCMDKKIECSAWASKGFCTLESVKRVCKLTCNICGENRIPTTPPQIQSCSDHPTCVSDFAPYCNIMRQISLKCPKLCGRCTTSGSSTKITSSTITTKTKPEKEFVNCYETSDRKDTCNSIAAANLCFKPDMMEHCPSTCKHPACQTTSSTSTTSTISSTIITTTVESKVCKYLPCSEPGVPLFCPKKCQGMTIPPDEVLRKSDPAYCSVYPCSIDFVKQTCKKCSDPEICVSLDCNYNGVWKLCKNKCMSSPGSTPLTTSSSTSLSSTTGTDSTTRKTDLPVCNWLPCGTPSILRICPEKCGSTQKMTTTATDPPFCAAFPCSMPQVQLACPIKCLSSSTASSTSPSSTSMMSTKPTDPPFCDAFPCSAPQVIMACPIKCLSTTSQPSTSIGSTKPSDSPLCVSVSCEIPRIELLCPNKCGSTTMKPTDAPICASLLCEIPQVKDICPKKCGLSSSTSSPTSPSTSPSSTTPTTLSSTISSSTSAPTSTSSKTTDPPFCDALPCMLPQVQSACPIKCMSTTSPSSTSMMSTKPTDAPICISLPCSLPQVNLICPNKCSSTTITSTSTMSTKQTDIPICETLPCHIPQALLICPNKCGSTTPVSSSTLSTAPTDLPICAFIPCNSPQMVSFCPNKCGSTVSSSTAVSSSTPVSTPKPDPEICINLPCSLPGINSICPNKCPSTTAASSTSKTSTTPTSVSTASTTVASTQASDPPFCINFPCEFAQVKLLCPMKCGTTSTSISSVTPKTDFPMCIFVSCDSVEAKMACPVKCGSSTSKITTASTDSSTPSSASTQSSTKAETDNPICNQLPCSNAGVQALCKKKCADKPVCTFLPCSNPGVRLLCVKKCADYSTGLSSSTTTPTTTTVASTSSIKMTTDPAFCSIFSCAIHGMTMACPIKCGSTTTVSTTKQTDPMQCLLFTCDHEVIKAICKSKCGG